MPAGLPACKQYINFKLVPRTRGGTDKFPIDQVGNIIDAHDPSKWVDAATAWASPWNVHGIGFVLTPGWIGIDLDRALRDGVWTPLVGELRGALPGAYADVSPSGTGYHLIMRGTLPDGHLCKKEWGEIYSLGRFLTVTGVHASGDANWDASAVTPWLYERLGLKGEPLPQLPDEGRSPLWNGPEEDDALLALMLTQVPRGAAQMFGEAATVRQVWEMDEAALARAWPADNRSDGLPYDYSSADMALMSHLSYFTGRDIPRMQRLFERWPGYRSWKYQRSRGYHMSRVLARGSTNKQVLGERKMLAVGTVAEPGTSSVPGEFLAYLPKNTYYHRPSGAFWVAQSVDNVIPPIAVDGGKTIKATKFISQNHYINQISWWPGMPEIIHGYIIRNGEMVQRPNQRVLNLYEPPLPPTGNAHDVQPWLDHIAKLYPEHWGMIVRWMAFVAQNPGVKVNWAIVIGGAMRIGKDTIIAPLIRAVGASNFQTVDPEYIMTQPYNEHLQSRVCLINEAKDMGGENRFQFYEKTKPIIASPPATHRINPKFGVQSIIPNLNATIIMTNYLTGGLYLPADDGRHAVFWSDCARGRGGIDDEYFTRLWSWLDGGGMENCAAYLMTIDVSDFKPKGMPPRTPAFYRMVEGGRSDEQNDIGDILALMGDRPFSVAELSMTARMQNHPELADWLLKKSSRLISSSLLEAGYIKHMNPDEKRGRWLVLGKQTYLYRLA